MITLQSPSAKIARRLKKKNYGRRLIDLIDEEVDLNLAIDWRFLTLSKSRAEFKIC
jgi:hypothetical protein